MRSSADCRYNADIFGLAHTGTIEGPLGTAVPAVVIGATSVQGVTEHIRDVWRRGGEKGRQICCRYCGVLGFERVSVCECFFLYLRETNRRFAVSPALPVCVRRVASTL